MKEKFVLFFPLFFLLLFILFLLLLAFYSYAFDVHKSTFVNAF